MIFHQAPFVSGSVIRKFLKRIFPIAVYLQKSSEQMRSKFSKVYKVYSKCVALFFSWQYFVSHYSEELTYRYNKIIDYKIVTS